MKYIKKYEEINPCLIYDDCKDSYYWLIKKMEPVYAKVALDKIGVDRHIDFFIDMIENNDIYIFKTINNEYDDWSYSGLNYINPSWRKPPIYMGEVTVEDYEIDAKKYNM